MMYIARIALVATGAVLWIGCGGATAGTTIDGSDGGADGSAVTGSGGIVSGGLNPSDAGPGGDTKTLSCGTATCAIPAQVCCIAVTSAGTAYACEPGTCAAADGGVSGGNGGGSGDAGGNGQGNQGDNQTVTLKCTDAANCAAGSVCCVTQNNNDTIAQCVTGASCGKNGAQLCDPAAASTGCTAAEPCSSKNIQDWSLPATFGTCGGVGM